MKPSNPNFIPPFTFLSSNPNPNFSHPSFPIPQPPPPKPSSTQITHSNSNIFDTISILKDLIDHANKTVNSVSDLIYSGNLQSQNEDLCCCPFDYRHRMPPEFLFRHSLRCPSSRGVIDLGILDSLQYPKSLKSEDELQKENQFVQPLQGSDAELCFCIDDYGDFDSNFFYKDCPGVVCSSELDWTKRMFTVPSVLSVHCANFVRDGVGESKEFDKEQVRILPSEFWALQREIAVWNDYPCSYSFSVLQVALYLPMIKAHDTVKWIISNSPRFGVVIDVPMRDHIYLLLKLCLKAVSYEAFHSSKLSNGGVGEMNPRSLSFTCPVLVDVLTWFASQLSVLYGEANGRLFSINMLKHCMLNAASCLMLFRSDQKKTVGSASADGCEKLDTCASGISAEFVGAEGIKNVKIEEPTENSGNENLFCGENKRSGLVFVSQVAAAIAALHERSLLEEKIKGLRLAGSLSKRQLISEHAYVTKKADEERKKRPNYRPILEYDGLLYRSHNEDSSKRKTKEELLAEERDYKRRRMSYRGKKVKRTITEVMRDIIEVHMDEIKQAGGIGGSMKGSAEGVVFPSGSVSDREMTADVKFRSSGFDSSETREVQRGHYREPLHANNSSTRFEHINLKDRNRRESHGRHESLDVHPRSVRKEGEQDREYRSRSPESYRSHGHSHDRQRHQRERDKRKVTKTKYDENRRSHESRSSTSMSNLSADFSDGNYDEMPRSEGRYRGRKIGTHRSDYTTPSTFDDRYNPSESYNGYDETYNDVSSDSKYIRADKPYKSR